MLIRGNLINAFGGAQDSHGIWLEDCGGAAPWIVDNERIQVTGARSRRASTRIRAVGDCHPVIDRNQTIAGGGEGQGGEPDGRALPGLDRAWPAAAW